MTFRSLPCVLAALAVTAPRRPPRSSGRAARGSATCRRTLGGRAPRRSPLPRLDVDTSLDASGFVYQADALSWSGGASYRRLSLGVRGAPDEVQNQLEYRLRTSLFPRRNSPLTLSAFASRADGDGDGGAGSYGATTVSYGADLAVRIPRDLRLTLGYTRTDGTRTGGVLPDTRMARDQFNASTAYSTPLYSYVAAYRGTLSEGTYAAENFDDHRVDVNARVRLARNTALQLSDGFYRRTPTLDSRFNPRQDLNVFSATLRSDRPPGAEVASHSVTYSHSSGVTDAADALLSRASQQLEYVHGAGGARSGLGARQPRRRQPRRPIGGRRARADRRPGPRGDALVAAGRGPTRASRCSAARPSAWLEPFDGSVEAGYGGSVGAALQRRWDALTGSAQYALSYGSGVGTRATTLSQQGSASAEGPAGPGLLRANLLLGGDRTNDPLFGSRASRSLIVRGEYVQRHGSVFVDASLRDGVANPLRTSLAGDGIFLAPSYDVHTRSVARRDDGLHREAHGARERPDDELGVPGSSGPGRPRAARLALVPARRVRHLRGGPLRHRGRRGRERHREPLPRSRVASVRIGALTACARSATSPSRSPSSERRAAVRARRWCGRLAPRSCGPPRPRPRASGSPPSSRTRTRPRRGGRSGSASAT